MIFSDFVLDKHFWRHCVVTTLSSGFCSCQSRLMMLLELFNPVFDKEVFHIELPLLQYFLQKHVRDEFLPFKRESMADYKVAVYPVEFAVLGNHNLYFSCHIRLVYGFLSLSRREVSSSSTSSILGRADFKFSGIALLNW